MPTPNQVLENNDLLRCLNEHRDIGNFHWLPDKVTLEPSGVEFVQYELEKLFEIHGSTAFPCLLAHDPSRPRDPHAMQIRTMEYIVGYVPERMGTWWQQQFDLLGNPRDYLVGLCRIERIPGDSTARYRPVCEFQVDLHRTSLQTA